MIDQDLMLTTFLTILNWYWIGYICILAVMSGILLLMSAIGSTSIDRQAEINDFGWSVCAITLTFLNFPIWLIVVGVIIISLTRDYIGKNYKK